MANPTLTNLFTDIADAIREKSDTSESIPALDFPDRIRSISGGGGGSDAPVFKSAVISNIVTVNSSFRPTFASAALNGVEEQ
jgi:hypothetical protein